MKGSFNTRRKKRQTLLQRFLKVFILSFVVLGLISGVTVASYVYIINQYQGGDLKFSDLFDFSGDRQSGSSDIEDKINIAIYGVDLDGYRTDVIMLAMMDIKNKNIDIISIPRDTKVELSDKIYQELKARRSSTPRVMKLNEVPAYTAAADRNKYSVQVMEELFSVEVDYYVNMNLAAFRNIVDLIGGVEVTVPEPGMYYNDPLQNLYISLKPGQQTLNGAQSEQFVRFRSGYADADIGRIRMQHEFMKNFMEKALSEKNRLNAIEILSEIVEFVDTDFGFSDALKYLQVFMKDDFNMNIEMHTLPGEGGGYYTPDMEATRQLLDYIENKSQAEDVAGEEGEKEEEVKPEPIRISSEDKVIEVLNATNENGLAGRIKTQLESDGFTVGQVGNYREESVDKTRIIVNQEGMGYDLITYFNEPVIMINPNELPMNVDIRIIIGEEK